MNGQYCDTCGDSYKVRLAGRNAARDKAKGKAYAEQTPYAICQEAGEYFEAKYYTAVEFQFNIVEIVSGLQDTAE